MSTNDTTDLPEIRGTTMRLLRTDDAAAYREAVLAAGLPPPPDGLEVMCVMAAWRPALQRELELRGLLMYPDEFDPNTDFILAESFVTTKPDTFNDQTLDEACRLLQELRTERKVLREWEVVDQQRLTLHIYLELRAERKVLEWAYRSGTDEWGVMKPGLSASHQRLVQRCKEMDRRFDELFERARMACMDQGRSLPEIFAAIFDGPGSRKAGTQ